MKKFITISCFGLLISLTACDHKDGYSIETKQITAPVINIITDLDNGSVLVKEGYYGFYLEMSTLTGMTGSVTSSELVANNTILSFTTDVQEYKSSGFDAFFENAKGSVVDNSSLQLNNATFEAIYPYDVNINPYNGYYYTLEDVGDLTYRFDSQHPWEAIAKFDIGNSYKINTFQKETFFVGSTSTSYPYQGDTQYYNTDDIIYRFTLDSEKDSSDYTATLVMYNAKFSSVPAEPTKTIVVKNLDVEFGPTGIKISSKNNIPYMYSKGEGLVEIDRFIFNSIEFTTTDDFYISGAISYEVAGMYKGYFEGDYIKNFYIK